MAKRIEGVEREEAVSNVARWALERNWTLARCAHEMGLNPSTLRGWMRLAGWRCEYRRIWVKGESTRNP